MATQQAPAQQGGQGRGEGGRGYGRGKDDKKGGPKGRFQKSKVLN